MINIFFFLFFAFVGVFWIVAIVYALHSIYNDRKSGQK